MRAPLVEMKESLGVICTRGKNMPDGLTGCRLDNVVLGEFKCQVR